MHVAAFLRDRPADAPREAAASASTRGALLEMQQVLGSAGSSSFCVVVSVSSRSAGRRRHFFFSFLVASSSFLSRVVTSSARARARDAARRHARGGYDLTSIETVTAIATGVGRNQRAAEWRRDGAARCSAVTRDGGGCGMAAAAGRGGRAAVRCFVEVAK